MMSTEQAESTLRRSNPVTMEEALPAGSWSRDALLSAVDDAGGHRLLAPRRRLRRPTGPVLALGTAVLVLVVGLGLGLLTLTGAVDRRPAAGTNGQTYADPQQAVEALIDALNAGDRDQFLGILATATVDRQSSVRTVDVLWEATDPWRTHGNASYSVKSCTGGGRFIGCRLRVDVDPLRAHGLAADEVMALSLDEDGRVSSVLHKRWPTGEPVQPSAFDRFLHTFDDWLAVTYPEEWSAVYPWFPSELIDWEREFELWAEYLATSPEPVWVYPPEEGAWWRTPIFPPNP